ncbi:6-bladed beta-propeller [uncultured Parabacteroides sp.]|uniref:6-bladed beta-propeller n=1 Tax=uncultured Parabacteroides sp. TaxID=512312 RepID=UPI0025DD0094|nr:6-bladed beta-propeller [uncultured Parabacteroides sp.]
MKVILLIFFISCSFFTKAGNNVTRIDMSGYKTVSFDSLVTNITCTKLEANLFDYTITMIPYKDNFYIMGRTIAGNKIVIFNKSGKLVKELTFPDALLVNSMTIVPELEEFWVISRFRIINKFKLDGTAIKKVTLPFPCANMIPVNRHDFLVYSGGTCNERGSIEDHFMALTDFKTIHKLFLPKWGKCDWPCAPSHIYAQNANRSTLFILPNEIDTIYTYNTSKEEVEPFYALDFHGDYLTKDKHPYGPMEDRDMAEIITKRKYIYTQYSFSLASGKLFLKLAGKREDFCTINLADNSLFSFHRLFDNFMPASYNPFIGSDGKNLYAVVREKELAEHYQNIRCSYPAIQKLLPEVSVNGNSWILLAIEIKE